MKLMMMVTVMMMEVISPTIWGSIMQQHHADDDDDKDGGEVDDYGDRDDAKVPMQIEAVTIITDVSDPFGLPTSRRERVS